MARPFGDVFGLHDRRQVVLSPVAPLDGSFKHVDCDRHLIQIN